MTASDRDRNQSLVALETIEAHLGKLVALATHANALQVHSIVVPQLLGARHADDVPVIVHQHAHLMGPLPDPDRLALWACAARRIVALSGAATESAAKKMLKAKIGELQAAEKGARR